VIAMPAKNRAGVDETFSRAKREAWTENYVSCGASWAVARLRVPHQPTCPDVALPSYRRDDYFRPRARRTSDPIRAES
jgi:hypothetical protein